MKVIAEPDHQFMMIGVASHQLNCLSWPGYCRERETLLLCSSVKCKVSSPTLVCQQINLSEPWLSWTELSCLRCLRSGQHYWSDYSRLRVVGVRSEDSPLHVADCSEELLAPAVFCHTEPARTSKAPRCFFMTWIVGFNAWKGSIIVAPMQ